MGYLSAVYDAFLNTGVIVPIKKFSAMGKSEDNNFSRRTGTYTLFGADGGIDPFGFNAMPAGIREVSYTFREYFHKHGPTDDTHHADPDAARDALMYAVGHGLPVLLEYTTGSGTKRYVTAKAKDMPLTLGVDGDISADFHITFEMQDPFWSDQFPLSITPWGHFSWGDGTVWGGTPTALDANTKTIVVNLTGATAYDLPRIVVNGPFGGSGGFSVTNGSLYIPTNMGNSFVTFTYNQPLTAGQKLTVDCASLDVLLHDGNNTNGTDTNVFNNIIWPPQQRYLFVLDPRTSAGDHINNIIFATVGTSPTSGSGANALVITTKRYW